MKRLPLASAAPPPFNKGDRAERGGGILSLGSQTKEVFP